MRKKLSSLIIVFTMVISMIVAMGVTVSAGLGDIKYIDAQGTTQTCSEYTNVDNAMTELTTGWYVLSTNVEINEDVAISGDVNLIILDNYELTVKGEHAIKLEEAEDTLSVYSGNTAENDVEGSGGLNAKVSVSNTSASVNLYTLNNVTESVDNTGSILLKDSVLKNSLISSGILTLRDSTITISDSSDQHNTTESSGSYIYNNSIFLSGKSTLTNATITETFAGNNMMNRVRGIHVTGADTAVQFVAEEGKTTSISLDRDKTRTRSQTGHTYGISLGDGSNSDNASIKYTGQGNLNITGKTSGGGTSPTSPYGWGINGIRVNGAKNIMTFANSGTTSITESGAYGVNALVNYGTTSFTAGNVLINSYIDGGVAFSNNIGLFNTDNGSKINVTDGVAGMTIFTEGAAGCVKPASGYISDGAAAIYNASYGGGSIAINAKKLNVLAISGEDTDKQWTIGGTTITGHTKYSSDKAAAVGTDKCSTTFGIKNEGMDSILIGADTVTHIMARDGKQNSVAVAAVPYEDGDYIETNGKIRILGDAYIIAEGGTGTLALYATKGNSIVIGSENKTVEITGGILADGTGITTDEEGEAKSSVITIKGGKNTINGNIEIKDGAVVNLSDAAASGDVSIGADSTLNLANTTIESGDVNNAGSIVVDMTGETAAKIKLIDYTGTGTPTYGSDGTNFKFAEGKDYDYVLKVIDNDLYAVKPVASITADSKTVNYTTVQDAINNATDGQTVKMIADSTECITIMSDIDGDPNTDDYQEITLDINGHVLKGAINEYENGPINIEGSQNGSVGKLTIIDSGEDAEHYFTYVKDGKWQIIDDPSDEQKKAAISVADITNGTSNNTVIKVLGGIITGAESQRGNGIYVGTKAVLNMLGGTVIGNTISKSGGAGIVNNGNFTMNGGAIIGNYNTEMSGGGVDNYATFKFQNGIIAYNTANTSGGGVNNESNCQFEMSGGKIIGNKSKNSGGSGIYNLGTFTMSDGEINGNVLDSRVFGSIYGSGVYNAAEFTMTGGKITGNTASKGGFGAGVYECGTMTVGGTAIITDNTKVSGTSTTANNLYLKKDTTIAIATDTNAPTTGMDVGVTLERSTGKFTSNGTENDKKYFSSDNAAYIVDFNEGDTAETTDDYLELTTKRVCKIGSTKYETIAAALAAQHGDESTTPTNIVMIADDEENVTIPSGRNITLDLNGFVLQGAGSGSVIINNGTLTVTDNSTEKYNYFSYSKDSAWTLKNTATDQEKESATNIKDITDSTIDGTLIKVEGSVITGGNVNAGGDQNWGGAIKSCNGSKLNVSNTNVINNYAKNMGGAICTTTNTTATITNVVFCNNTAGDWGGAIHSKSESLTVTDSTFIGNKSINQTAGGAGAVSIYKGNLKDCVFKYNQSYNNCGALQVDGGKVITKGCTFEDNTAAANGGAIVFLGANSDLTFEDCTVKNNTCGANYNGGGILLATNGSLTIGGSTRITGNHKGTDTVNNLYLQGDKTVTIGTKTGETEGNGVAVPVTTDDNRMTVGITTETAPTINNPIAITGDNNADYSKCFTSDNSNYKVYNTGSDLLQIVKLSVHEHTWNYGTGTTTETDDSLTAWCSEDFGKDKCDNNGEANAQKVAIQAPSDTEYSGTAKTATLSGTTLGGLTLDAASIKYKKENADGGWDDISTAPSAVGSYKASITIGSGDKARTASIEFAIGKKQLTVTGTTADGKDYNGNTAAVAHIGTVGGIVGTEDVNVEIDGASFNNKNAGNKKTVTVSYKISGNDAGNYTKPENSTATADIEKKAITVTAENKTSYVGSELVELTYAAGTLCDGDSWTGALTTNANKNNVANNYTITRGTLEVSDGNEGNNYSITFNQGTYTVTAKEVQTLSFDGVSNGNVSKTYGDADFTEAVSGAETAVTYSSSNEDVATVDSNGKVKIKKAGTATIKATAAETAVYAKGEAQYVLTVNKIKVTVPQATTGLVYNGEEQTGVVLPADAKYELSDNKKTDAGSYTAIASLKDKDNYAWNNVSPESEDQNIQWSIAQAPVTVTANDKSMILGKNVPTLTATIKGIVSGEEDKITYSFKNIDKPEAQGVYSIVPTGDVSQGNYTVTYKQGKLTVTKADSKAVANPEDVSRVLDNYRAKQGYENKTLDVEVRTDGKVSQSDKKLIAQNVSEGKKIKYIDTDLYLIERTGSGETETDIGDDNDVLIGVTYKFSFSGKNKVQVLRVHNEVVEELTTVANEDGEYVVFNKEEGTIKVYAKKYSTYAFAYNTTNSGSGTKTGDTNNLMLYFGLFVLGLLETVIVLYTRLKKNR